MARVTPDDVAAAILEQCGSRTTKQLQKLVYFTQAWHIAIRNEPVFDELCEAWVEGPVVRSLYAQHRRQLHVSHWTRGDAGRLDPFARNVVSMVCNKYGDFSGDELSQITHMQQPWLNARRGLRPKDRANRAISLEDMATHYRASDQKLGGRTAADLAVGGLRFLAERSLDDATAEDLRELRRAFDGEPRVHAAPERWAITPEDVDAPRHPAVRRSRARPAEVGVD